MKISNECNMELMARYKDNHFDLAIVDPPYADGNELFSLEVNLKNKERKHNVKDWNDKAPKKEYFNELFRVSKNQIIWGANYFEGLPPSRGWIFWDKRYEGMHSFSDGELAYTSFHKLLKKFTYRGDVKKTFHPTQKPVKLYEWLLMNYAKEGDKILDTHLGSGSIAIACHNLKFDLTACELDKEYYDSAMKRIKRHQQQIQMF
jgi:site-specific DNA-methyltransferase (adenine-specific)